MQLYGVSSVGKKKRKNKQESNRTTTKQKTSNQPFLKKNKEKAMKTVCQQSQNVQAQKRFSRFTVIERVAQG